MLDSRKINPTCRFSEDVVSYLYDEMRESERVEFDGHLNSCSSCPEELAGFASVSSSVQGWRDIEFTPIPTPAIEVPYVETTRPVETSATSAWIDYMRQIFNFSPVFFKTASALGALAIVLGLGWFLVAELSGGQEIIAEKKDEIVSPESRQEKVEEVIPAQVAANEKNDSETISPKTELIEINEIAKETAPNVKPIRVRNAPIKTKSNRVRKNKTTRVSPVKKTVKPPVVEEVPRLTEELAIEDTDELRLTDIFSEVGSDD